MRPSHGTARADLSEDRAAEVSMYLLVSVRVAKGVFEAAAE
jgi:hypothetical protein